MEIILFLTFFIVALIFFISGKDDFGRKSSKNNKETNTESKEEEKLETNTESKEEEKLETNTEVSEDLQ